MSQTKSERDIDYHSLGLKCGLELHQQLDTGRKLFCHCKTELRLDEPMAVITRHMRPTLSELGEYDKAALMEFKKQKTILYEIHDSICSYEIDETPPFEPDPDAIDLAITIAKMLQMDILDELNINRKQYLDGSIPTGFQRTMIVGMGGKVKVGNKTVNLDMLALEEDSCREVGTTGKEMIWRVDRLGIPLVEIATKTISVNDPEEVKDFAEAIGRILRATGKVKRGLGTIRQDLNISIANGARIEVKGVQILDMLPQYIRLEVNRQLNLLAIRNELEKRKANKEEISTDYKDCKEILAKSKCKFITAALAKKEQIFGIKLPKMKGLIGKIVQGERSFGKEIADRVKVIVGLGGLIHTDELPNYGITQNELDSLYTLFDCEKEDAVTFIIGSESDCKRAIEEIVIRIKEAFDGVPEETRHALDDGTTSFRRYLGGAGRMYPDTDSYPITISETRLQRILENLPELPEKKEERYIQELALPEDVAKNLAISSKCRLFDELVKIGIDPMIIAVSLEQTIKSLTRDNVPTNNLTDERITEIFTLLAENKIAKEAIEPLFRHFSENPKDRMPAVLKELGLEALSLEELQIIINELLNQNSDFIKENGSKAKGKLMGDVMKQVRGKVDGQLVNNLFTKSFNEKLMALKIED